jgi:hypothetical protein
MSDWGLEVEVNNYRVSVWGDEKVLETVVLIQQHKHN